MPTVDGKKYPYTKEGKEQASKAGGNTLGNMLTAEQKKRLRDKLMNKYK